MATLLGNIRKGKIFILSAPAGTGKTTLIRLLANEFPRVVASLSFTTRLPRLGEKEGVDYCFISEREFQQKIINGDFLEYVKLYDTFYGTSRSWVEEKIHQGKFVFLVIDTQGALNLKDRISATYIFIRPPSLQALEQRLMSRGTEQKEMINKRLAEANKELSAGKLYDYEIVNDDLETAYQVLRSVVIAESHRLTHTH